MNQTERQKFESKSEKQKEQLTQELGIDSGHPKSCTVTDDDDVGNLSLGLAKMFYKSSNNLRWLTM